MQGYDVNKTLYQNWEIHDPRSGIQTLGANSENVLNL